MAKKIHQTPPGFEQKVLESGRVTFKPKMTARMVHERFLYQVAGYPLHFADPGIEITNHVRHGHHYFLSTDLKSAFDQVTAKRLRAVLEHRDINPGWLTPQQYFFHENGFGGLIQGAPSSSYLFETYCHFSGLDAALFEYCDKLGFYYSRCADDILISSRRKLGKRVGPKIREIVGVYGFTLNDSKTKRVNVRHEPLKVLGYTIRGDRIEPSRDIIQKLFDPKRSDASRKGLFHWRRHVRKLDKRTK